MKIPSHSSVSVGGYPVCDGSHQLFVYDRRLDQVGGTALADVLGTGLFEKVSKMKYDIPNDKPELFDEYMADIDKQLGNLH